MADQSIDSTCTVWPPILFAVASDARRPLARETSAANFLLPGVRSPLIVLLDERAVPSGRAPPAMKWMARPCAGSRTL